MLVHQRSFEAAFFLFTLGAASPGCGSDAELGPSGDGATEGEQVGEVAVPQTAQNNDTPQVLDTSQPDLDATVLATITTSDGHQIQLVEFMPGMTGSIEEGRAMRDVPVLTPELKQLSLTNLYTHFEGESAAIPETLAEAEARRIDFEAQNSPQEGSIELNPDLEASEEAPNFYTADEQVWFQQTFCASATACRQAIDEVSYESRHRVTSGSSVAFNGSEAANNGRHKMSYWEFTGQHSYYVEFYRKAIQPGLWRSINITGGDHWIKFEMDGPTDTLVSLIATY